jgi:hypothetical protein
MENYFLVNITESKGQVLRGWPMRLQGGSIQSCLDSWRFQIEGGFAFEDYLICQACDGLPGVLKALGVNKAVLCHKGPYTDSAYVEFLSNTWGL